MMKTRFIQIVIIILTIISFGCQKSDLKKDGYFVFKANDKKVSFNSCIWWLDSYMDDTIPVHMNNIFAYQRKDMGGTNDSAWLNMQADHVYIIFDGNTTGIFSTPVWVTQPNAFYIEIVYKGVLYSMFQMDQNGNPYCNVQMDIDTYDVDNGIIEGSISGAFFNYNSNSTIEISHCDFCAKNKK
jgi:hypothetical protein